MTREQVEVVQDTFLVVKEMAGPMTQLFYGRLFQMSPELRPLFRGDIKVQGRKFADMLAALVEALPDLDRYSAQLRAMGHRHTGYGVKPEHYSRVGDALLWAVAQAVDREFTPAAKVAWSAMITEVAAMMLGAQE